jgi:putative nucleotidyltransferase-like protein
MTAASAQAQIAAIDQAIAICPVDSALSSDFLLTAACCHWPQSEKSAAAIRAAARNIKDWDRFLHVLKRHRVAGLITQALRCAGIVLPSPKAQVLETFVDRVSRYNLRLAGETVRLQSLFASAGIPVIVLKGPTLERLVYGRLVAMQTRDIDLLVPPECAEAAVQILERDGYILFFPANKLSGLQRRALVRYAREVELVDSRKKSQVELQWRAADNPFLLDGVDARAATQTISLSESAVVRTLALDDLFAYLCVHGARHSWSRLKWLAELNALLVSTNADIEHLYRHAQRIGAGLCAAQGLLLCHQLLGLKLPTALVHELQTKKRHRKLVDIAMRAMTAPSTGSDRDPGIRGVLREVRNRFLLGHGLRFYLAECRLALVGSADIVRLPLPRPLHFIYPLVRVPLWLWRRAKLAFAPL